MLCLGLGGCGGGSGVTAGNGATAGNGVTASNSSLTIPDGPGGFVTSADWYFPTQADGRASVNGLVWLQPGDTAALAAQAAQIARQIAEQTNSIVVVPVMILQGPYRIAAMQQAVADMMLGNRVALATSATAAGYKGALPEPFLFAGQRTGGGFVAEVAARTVLNGAAANLLGVVMFDGVASPDQFAVSLDKLESMGIPVYQIASPPQAANNWGGTTEQLVALVPDQFVGVQFDDISPLDAVVTLATGWIKDMYDGKGPTDPRYGIYGNPNNGPYVANRPLMIGETGLTVLPAPPPVDINQYAGSWYEQGSVKQDPSVVLVNVKEVFTPQPDDSITVENSGNISGPSGPARTVTGSAVPVNAANTRLSVSFSGPPARDEPGNYWILDYAPDYSWAIVGNASGSSGTILTRDQVIPGAEYNALVARAIQLGVRGTITPTAQYR